MKWNQYQKENWNVTNMWKLNNIFLSNQCVKDKVTKKIRKYLETNENKNTTYQNLGDAAKAGLRGKHSCKCTHWKRKKFSNNTLTLHLKKLEKEEKTKLKASRRKGIEQRYMKLRTEK